MKNLTICSEFLCFMEWKRSKRRFSSRKTLFYCLLSVCALFSIIGATTVCLDVATSSSVRENDCYLQDKNVEKEGEMEISRTSTRNGFGSTSHGLGSYPPQCKSKCGKCTPCKPVHVLVPPSVSAPTEYYPEAWRCKCGNKLYMP